MARCCVRWSLLSLFLLLLLGCGPVTTQPPRSADGGPETSDKPLPETPNSKHSTPQIDAAAEAIFEVEDDFQMLTFTDFDAFGAGVSTWTATDNGLTCLGKPKGYLYSKLEFRNFTWRLDYRFPRPENLRDETKFKGNTGFLVGISGEHKIWPMCLEVQGKHGQMAAIKENGGAVPVTTVDNEDARQKARKPLGQWNSIEIVSNEGALAVSLNGIPVSRSEPAINQTGMIGIQAEDHPFEVRRIRVRRD